MVLPSKCNVFTINIFHDLIINFVVAFITSMVFSFFVVKTFCFLTVCFVFFFHFYVSFVLTSVHLSKHVENCVLQKRSLFLIFLAKLRINIDISELQICYYLKQKVQGKLMLRTLKFPGCFLANLVHPTI